MTLLFFLELIELDSNPVKLLPHAYHANGLLTLSRNVVTGLSIYEITVTILEVLERRCACLQQ